MSDRAIRQVSDRFKYGKQGIRNSESPTFSLLTSHFSFLTSLRFAMPLKILIVDDEPNIVVPLQFLMEQNGYQVILAANSEAREVTATFALPGVEDGTEVRVRFEDRKLQATGSAFSDKFDEFGVHVYEIGR